MMRAFFSLGLILLAAPVAPAAVVVLGNFTPDSLTCTISEPGKPPQSVAIAPAQILPVTVSGPADAAFATSTGKAAVKLDPYHAYVFVPDDTAGVKIQGVFMPGDPLERDQRPEVNPPPKGPVTIPVTLLVDDADPRADALWQRTLRQRFDEAAEVLAAHAPIKLEFAGFATWESSPDSKDMTELLADFTAKVKAKPGTLAIGYTSRVKVDPKESQHLVPFGAVKTAPTGHILLRESGPRTEPEKVEAMLHHLGLAFGATLIDPDKDPGTVMRSKIADGLALRPQYRYRFDPLNTLALNIWAEELRRAPIAAPTNMTDAGKFRLARIYKALLKERPGDSNALAYLAEFDREIAKAPEPKAKEPEKPKVDVPPPMESKRDQVAKAVIWAVVARARANPGLTGDDLTNDYVKAAAVVAWREDGPLIDQEDRMSGLLIGLAIALDDSDALRSEPMTADSVRAIEPDADRAERLKVLGNPTLAGRRDLCRRFLIGCGLGELLRTPSQAEQLALERSFSKEALAKPNGASFAALAAEFAGIELSRRSNLDLIHAQRLTGESTLATHLVPLTGLREGLSAERVREDYGDAADPRFQKVLGEIRERVKKHKY